MSPEIEEPFCKPYKEPVWKILQTDKKAYYRSLNDYQYCSSEPIYIIKEPRTSPNY